MRIDAFTEEVVPFPLDREKQLTPGVMWVMRDIETGAVEAVTFLCPCGACNRETYTPVVEAPKPKTEHHWVYAPGPTISPSIRWLSGCKSHFNITNGKVIWHGDSGQ